jgi:hypothetical protein
MAIGSSLIAPCSGGGKNWMRSGMLIDLLERYAAIVQS